MLYRMVVQARGNRMQLRPKSVNRRNLFTSKLHGQIPPNPLPLGSLHQQKRNQIPGGSAGTMPRVTLKVNQGLHHSPYTLHHLTSCPSLPANPLQQRFPICSGLAQTWPPLNLPQPKPSIPQSLDPRVLLLLKVLRPTQEPAWGYRCKTHLLVHFPSRRL